MEMIYKTHQFSRMKPIIKQLWFKLRTLNFYQYGIDKLCKVSYENHPVFNLMPYTDTIQTRHKLDMDTKKYSLFKTALL